MSISRREFMQSTGALAICFSLSACGDSRTRSTDGSVQLGNRITIRADGSVELHMGKVELGQGIGTALAQIAADELGVAFERMRLINVDTDHSPDEFYTFSSISIQQSGPKVRDAAARGRRHLLERAAVKLGTGVGELSVVDGLIKNGDASSDLDYWQLLGDSHELLELGEEDAPEFTSDYKVVGKAVPRIDIPGKIFGSASYIQDLRPDGMVHARIVRPPAERAKLISLDSEAIEQMPGVLKVVRDGNFLGVVAAREGQARAASRALAKNATWKTANDLPESSAIYGWLKLANSRLEEVAARGSVDVSSNDAIRATYQRPHQAHASISPAAAVALYDESGLTVWSHAQGMYPLREALAHTLDLPLDQVRCVHKEASGCYGHNGADDAACDAAALAMSMPGRPVRLQWERADEFQWEPFGPAMQIEIQARLGEDGVISDWQHDLWSCPHTSRPRGAESAGNLLYAQHKKRPLPIPAPRSIPQPSGGADRNAVPLYDFENVQVNKHLVTDIPVRGSALRGLGAYANVFAIESFMDELAYSNGTDPFEFRLRHLRDERAADVLRRLQAESDWSARPEPGGGAGWGLGFAKFKNLASYLGIVMQLHADASSGQIDLVNAIAVCDAGLVINPDGLKAQIEGGIIQSASWTLKEQVEISASQIETRDWSTYPILRFDEVPEVTVHLIDRRDQKSLGVGETAQGPTAAAIANAVFYATGQRLRRLPFTPARFT
jgi:CO/xanthine dehydrogenase Mo-binding subunit